MRACIPPEPPPTDPQLSRSSSPFSPVGLATCFAQTGFSLSRVGNRRKSTQRTLSVSWPTLNALANAAGIIMPLNPSQIRKRLLHAYLRVRSSTTTVANSHHEGARFAIAKRRAFISPLRCVRLVSSALHDAWVDDGVDAVRVDAVRVEAVRSSRCGVVE